MKFGICEGVLPNDWSLEKKFAVAKEIGFDGIELWMGDGEAIDTNISKEELLKVRALADQYGIALPSFGNQFCWTYMLSSDDPEKREKAKTLIRRQLEIASILGCETILVLPGAVGVDFIKDSEVIDYEIAYQRAVEGLKELAVDAEKYGVTIGIENVSNKMLLSPLEARALIDEVGSPYVGMYLDAGNVLEVGYTEHWARILGERVKKVHLKDFSVKDNAIVDLLTGDVNYPAMVQELRKVGYDGWITAEYLYEEDTYVEGTQMLLNAMKKIDSF